MSGLFCQRASAQEQLFRRGDIDQGGVVDISDASAIFNFLFLGGRAPDCLDAVDANDDGANDVTDGIYVLNWLFLGGPIMPAPSPDSACPGADPTGDSIGCELGVTTGGGEESPPSAELMIVWATPPGFHQRSRVRRERNAQGHYIVEQGEPFALLLEATRGEVSRAPFDFLTSGVDGGANPSVLDVRCDRPLGDIPAGENLAPYFGRNLEVWSDRVYLYDHIAMSFDDPSGNLPVANVYRFTARVTDTECATSMETTLTLQVRASRNPIVTAWIERASGEPGVWAQNDPGSGNHRLERSRPAMLVVEAAGNPFGGDQDGFAFFEVEADPPFPGDPRFVNESHPDWPNRVTIRLENDVFPGAGNTTLDISVRATREGTVGRTRLTVEVPVGYAGDVQPIWNARCSGCHEAPNPRASLELVHPDPVETRRNIVGRFATQPEFGSIAPRLVRPYSLKRSYLWHKISGSQYSEGVLGDGAGMPLGESPISDGQLHLFESWVLQGAP